jgi:hypothetical protein
MSQKSATVHRHKRNIHAAYNVTYGVHFTMMLMYVLQVFTADELSAELSSAGQGALVVVDFYKTACGACKFIQPG